MVYSKIRGLRLSWCAVNILLWYDEEQEVGIDEAVTYEAAPSGTMRRIHKELENLIGTTFGSYRFYDEWLIADRPLERSFVL